MRIYIALILVSYALSSGAQAAPPDLIAHYVALAGDGFVPSALRGRELFLNTGGADEKVPNCAACHGSNPAVSGRHVFTGKTIKPLAPAGNPARFTDIGKVEKWFRRNCKDVLERECTAGEKADVVQFLIEVTQQ